VIKNRCSPVSLVLFVAVCAFLICAVNVQAQNTGIPGGCVAEEGNLNKANCTANDVRLTAVVGKPTIFDECHGGTNAGGLCPNGDADCPGGTCGAGGCTNLTTDTVTFSAVGQFSAGPQRYDVGIYIATDGDAVPPGAKVGDGARTGECTRFDFGANTVDLDGDACGDILANSTQNVEFGPVTVRCVDTDGDGKLDIINCETWGNGANEVPTQNSDCTGTVDVVAGTPSKCGCGLLPVCIAVEDANVCDVEECKSFCGASNTTCTTDADCSAGVKCVERVVHTPLADGSTPEGCNAAGDQCNNPSQCTGGTCVVGGPKADGANCEAPPTDAGGLCDAQDTCLSGTCVEKVKPAGTVCRLAQNECDAAETCDGTSPNCPTDMCGPLKVRAGLFCTE